MEVQRVDTTPYSDQKPGTSGLRKKTKVFQQDNYLENFIQSIFNSLPKDELNDATIVVSGDGRYYNDVAIQKIIQIAAGNGIRKLLIGTTGLLATPALSTVIRGRGAYGGIILTASHNPGGPTNDFGVKYNVKNGGPAPASVTAKIFEHSKAITHYSLCQIPEVSLKTPASYEYDTSLGKFSVEVIDLAEDYLKLMKSIFDFKQIRKLIARSDFEFCFDALSGVGGPYAKRIFGEELGVPAKYLLNCEPLPDFGGGHPDPNLTYAHGLVHKCGLCQDGSVRDDIGSDERIPDLGAAADGDADRNMILGRKFFVTPSDSVAILAANHKVIPFFSKQGLRALCRSMPTSQALDRVAQDLGVPLFEVPTGWKYFGNLMDSHLLGGNNYTPLICGEESFGTGSSHIREKDGPWAVLCWLSILSSRNENTSIGQLISVEQIVTEHWQKYGRNYYCRYDYEGVDKASALNMMARMRGMVEMFSMSDNPRGTKIKSFELKEASDFRYVDPVDNSVAENQGIRFIFTDGSRVVFRLSGTGSVGATIRLYIEKYQPPDATDSTALTMKTADALSELVEVALILSKLESFTGRNAPTVIT